MTLKNSIRTASIFILMTIALTASASNIVPVSAKPIDPSGSAVPRTQELILRLEVIRDMDKSGLTNLEKKNLRKEVREIKRETRSRNGVYISLGAGIIIILLLILLL